MREVYAATPSELRSLARRQAASEGTGRGQAAGAGPGGATLSVRLAVRPPYDATAMHAFLAAHLCSRVESVDSTTYTRSLLLPHGPAVVTMHLGGSATSEDRTAVEATLRLSDLRDLAAATERCRRLLDADSDPVPVADVLVRDPLLEGSVRSRPGLRLPGAPDGDELAVRTVLGQQVSLTAANRLSGHLVELVGADLPAELAMTQVSRTFPTAAAVAGIDPSDLPLPRARAGALVRLAESLADAEVSVDRSVERQQVRADLLALPGIGPWTADYICMRALGDPDVFLPDDAAARRVAGAASPALLQRATLASRAESWRPWRSYALMHLWADVIPVPKMSDLQERRH
jgi:AraC family transcriptional regulator of adaptative response / DNA-3-methyladenine glycosylase II